MLHKNKPLSGPSFHNLVQRWAALFERREEGLRKYFLCGIFHFLHLLFLHLQVMSPFVPLKKLILPDLERCFSADIQQSRTAFENNITPLLRELHWLPVRLHVDFKILLVTFKILHGVAPSYLKDLVSVLPDLHYQLRRSNNCILLERPRLRTKKAMGDRAFSIAVPFLWNSLPLPIRQEETSIDSFKHSVKTCLKRLLVRLFFHLI